MSSDREQPTCPQHGTELEERGDHFHCPDCAELVTGSTVAWQSLNLHRRERTVPIHSGIVDVEREECPTCGVRDVFGEGVLIPVWENPSDYDRDKSPDYLGCTECHTMQPYKKHTR